MLAILAAASLPALGQGSWTKLSDGQAFSDVGGFKISPGGDRVVYTHDANVDGALELWSVPAGGGTPARLSAMLPAGSHTGRFLIAPDGLRVVYIAPQDTVAVNELYSVPILGGTTVKLNDPLVDEGDVVDFQISPDSGRVVYRADQETDGLFELYGVPIAGGMVAKLSGPLVAEGDVFFGYRISPDSSRVVYIANQTPPDVDELYSVPIAGGGVVKLNDTLPGGGDVGIGGTGTYFRISPDSSCVVYWADQETDDVFELYAVPIAGGVRTKLNGTLVAGGDVSADFLISPDGSRVVYRATQDTVGVGELYRVSITGGAVTKLSGALVAGGGVQFDFGISPDGSRAVFLAVKNQANVVELYSVRIDVALPALATRLNGPLSAPDEVREFRISPDGNWVVYRATSMGAPLGYRVPITGGAAEAIWDSTPTFLFLQDYKIAPASDRVVVLGVGANPPDATERLWQGRLTGIANPGGTELTPLASFPSDGNVLGFDIGSDGRIVYLADQEFDGVFELYAISDLLFSDGFEG